MRRGVAVTALVALVAALPVLVVATARAESASATIDFAGLAEGSLVERVAVGAGMSGIAIDGFVAVRGERRAVPGVNRAMVFDGACLPRGSRYGCTGGDTDLFFPALGNLLIVSEDGDGGDPDDAEDGKITFDFRGFGPGAVTVESLVLADTDNRRPYLTLVTGAGPSTTRLSATGDRSSRQVNVRAAGVVEMTLDLRGAGAVDQIVLTVEAAPPPSSTTSTTSTTTTTTTTTTATTTTTTTTTLPAPPPAGVLAMTVLANGTPAGAAPGPEVTAGDPVAWTYDVTNSGAGSLWALYLWHDGVGRADCPDRSLAPGETVRCTAGSTAAAGSYEAAVRAWAWDDAGAEFAAAGEARYVGLSTAPPFVPAPALDLETFVADADADTAPGPVVTPGSTVEFRYVVRNSGNVELWGLWLRDGALGTITCPARYLRPGDTVTCLATRAAAPGQFAADAEAWGWDAYGGAVSDSDAHHYLGATGAPAIGIEALVEGFDGDTPPGPRVRRPGETIMFTYVVANAGGVPLSAVQVTDDRLGAVDCPAAALAVGEAMTCHASTVAELGEFASAGRVGAESMSGPVAASDPIYYHVRSEPRIHNLALEVTVNGRDADDAASAPIIVVGQSARFVYLVTYTGNNIVYNVTIQDPFVADSLLSCSGDRTLTAGETLRCTATVRATAGAYAALVSVVSWDANGVRVSAEDWVHYYGMA